MFIPSIDVFGWNVVTASAHAGLHALDVKSWTGESGIPNIDLDTLRSSQPKQAGNCVCAKRSLEGIEKSLFDCSFKKSHAGVPGKTVRICLRKR